MESKGFIPEKSKSIRAFSNTTGHFQVNIWRAIAGLKLRPGRVKSRNVLNVDQQNKIIVFLKDYPREFEFKESKINKNETD